MPERGLVCDTTLLLYLGRIGQLDLLPALFTQIRIPETVVFELEMGRLLRSDTVDPGALDWAEVVAVPQDVVEGLPPTDWEPANGLSLDMPSLILATPSG